MPTITEANENLQHASSVSHQRGQETQPYGCLVKRPIALDESTSRMSVESLNQLPADTIAIRDICKKHHWQNDLLVSVSRADELQVSFVAEHAVDTPVVKPEILPDVRWSAG